MNKKFFTFLATVALLFSTAFAASAQTVAGPTTPLKTNVLYHLWNSADSKVLFINATNDSLKYDVIPPGFLNSLWCASAKQPSASKYPEFTFTNKGAEEYLSVNIDSFTVKRQTVFPAVIGDGDISVWKFSSKYVTGLDAAANYLASYLDEAADSIAVLTHDAAKVYVEIIKAPEGNTTPTTQHPLLTFNLATPLTRTLTAADFNTIFGTVTSGKRAVNIAENIKKLIVDNNIPFANPIYAYQAKGTGNEAFLNFTQDSTANPKKFLRVDTSYVNTGNVQFLGFQFADTAATKISKQYNFRVTYSPVNDSLAFAAQEVRYKKDQNTWESSTVKTVGATVQTTDSTYISIQDLITNKTSIVTVGGKANAWFGLGLGACDGIVGDTRTTLASDLYFIKNADGKYLAAPIYTDSSKVTTAKAVWVSLENQDATRLPAYQWVVVKTKTADKYVTTSPITITNREYPAVVLNSGYTIQLYSDQDLTLEGVKKPVIELVSKTYANVLKDSILGYKALPLTNQEYKAHTYNFNYLHQFSKTKYLDVNPDAKDSLIYVADEATSFQLEPQSMTLQNFGTPLGTSQLKRVSYKLVVKDSYKFNKIGKYLAVDSANNRYYLADAPKASVFFLKEQNYTNDKPYYALVDTTIKYRKTIKVM